MNDLLKTHAPTVALLIGAGLVYDLTGKTNVPIVLERETITSPGEKADTDTVFEIVGTPLPITYVEYSDPSHEAVATADVYKCIEETLLSEIRRSTGNPKAHIGEAYAALQSDKFYGPYLVTDNCIIQLTADVVRMIVVQYPTVTKTEKGWRVSAIIVPELLANYNRVYGVARWY